jgi:hypothetical protein
VPRIRDKPRDSGGGMIAGISVSALIERRKDLWIDIIKQVGG